MSFVNVAGWMENVAQVCYHNHVIVSVCLSALVLKDGKESAGGISAI